MVMLRRAAEVIHRGAERFPPHRHASADAESMRLGLSPPALFRRLVLCMLTLGGFDMLHHAAL